MSSPTRARTPERTSSGPNPGSARASSSTSTDAGTTFTFSPARTIVALTVFRSSGSSDFARSPRSGSARSVSRGFSSASRTSRCGRPMACAMPSIIRRAGAVMCTGRRLRSRARGDFASRDIVPARWVKGARAGGGREAWGEPRHRPVALDHGAVAAAARDASLQPADLLLGDLDRIQALAAELQREAAELADRVLHPVEQLRLLLDEELRTEVAAVLLVGQDGQHDVAGELRLLACCPEERGEHHRDAAFHVQRTAAPDGAVDEPPAERRPRPVLPRRGHDVDVALKKKRRALPASA